MKIRTLLFGLLLAASPAFAADVDGSWSGSIDTPNGPVTVAYTFKADGAKLTGTTTGPDGGVLQIKDGKIDGNKISFAVDIDMGGQQATIAYTGVVAPATIQFTLDFMGMPVEFAVQKAK